MWDYFWDFGDILLRYTGHLNRQEWFYVLGAVTVVGFLCLRGFGSRSKY